MTGATKAKLTIKPDNSQPDYDLRRIELRHAQDEVWFSGGLHDPHGYIAMAHKDRAALIEYVRREIPRPMVCSRQKTIAEARQWLIAMGYGEYLHPAPPLPITVNPTVSVPKVAWDWLMGIGPDDKGHHFGDSPEAGPGQPRLWWRTTLRRMTGL